RHVPSFPTRRSSDLLAAEQEFFHFTAQVLACFGVERVEPVLVDEDGLARQPLLPGGLGDLGVDALAQRAGPGGEVEAFGVGVELDRKSTRLNSSHVK